MFWKHFTSQDIERLAQEGYPALLPFAAIENHGAHLPVGTDTLLMEAFLNDFASLSPARAVVLPVQAAGLSPEHLDFAGTISLRPETLLSVVRDCVDSLLGMGFEKFIFLSSHGGNMGLLDIAAREIRVGSDIPIFVTNFKRFLSPADLQQTEQTFRTDIHAGLYETSLMLHYYPELVRSIPPLTPLNPIQDHVLSSRHTLNWLMSDFGNEGVVGDASSATASLGKTLAEKTVTRLYAFCDEVARFSLAELRGSCDIIT